MRFIEVLKEPTKGTKKPLGVVLRDGSVAGPGKVVSEDAVAGGSQMVDRLLDEKPCRVKKRKAAK